MRHVVWIAVCLVLCGCPSERNADPDASAADGGGAAAAAGGDSGSEANSGTGGNHGAGQSGESADGGATSGQGGAGGSGGGAAGSGGLGGGGGMPPSAGTGGAAGSAGQAGGGGGPAPAGKTLIVGVGSFGFRGRSSDGATWTYCGEPSSGDDHAPTLLRNAGYGDGVFIAVGGGDANGMVMRSLDGVHWQEDVHPTNACPGEGYPSSCANWMGAVTYHAGVWLAAGGNGAIMRSTDGGATWKGVKSTLMESRIRAMGAGSGRFLAGSDGGAIWVSSDNGDHWAKKTPWAGAGASAYLQFAHGAGTFIAFASDFVASGERACFVSSNLGDTWEACPASVKANISFVHDGTRWVTPASGGYATSSDGKSWTPHTASNVPPMLLFDGAKWYGRSGKTIYRGDTPDTFAKVAMNVEEFRGWTIGQVLDSNLPVTGVPECHDNR